MKKTYRKRRSRTQAEAGSIGAPFTGIFSVALSADLPNGIATATAYEIDPVTGGAVTLPVWHENWVIDLSAVVLVLDGVVTIPTTISVEPGGATVRISFDPPTSDIGLQFVGGHTSLQSMRGIQCGGGLLFGLV